MPLAPLTAAERAQAQAAALALEKALSRSELAQAPLDLLGQLLAHTAMAQLLDATERLDFGQALVQLQRLRVHWMDVPTESVA